MSILEFNNQVVSLNKMLYHFALSLTRDTENAQDLCQETLLKAYLHRSKYSPGTNLKAWLYTIMKNTFFNSSKRQKKTNDIFYYDEDISIINNKSHLSVEEYYNVYEINKAIDGLKDLYKIPFKLFVEGFKYDEIGKKLNIPQGTVKSRIFFARKKLGIALVEFNN
jgi:RNA polymerase sigma factor (sigma-70 family)